MPLEQATVILKDTLKEKSDFSWLEFYGKRVEEKLSGVNISRGEIQFKPNNLELQKKLDKNEIKFLEQFADLKVTYWVKQGVDVASLLESDDAKVALLGGGLIAPVKQWEIDEEASIVGDTFKKLGSRGDSTVMMGISLPGFDQSRFKKGEVTGEQVSSESAARLVSIIGKLMDCHSQNTVFVGHSSYAEAGVKHLSDVCQVIALEPPFSEGSDPVFTMISGLNELSHVGDKISKSLTNKARDWIIKWRAGLTIDKNADPVYLRSANRLAEMHHRIMERAFLAYVSKCQDLAKLDRSYVRKRVVRYMPDVLLGNKDILTPAKAGLAWIDRNFEGRDGQPSSRVMTSWSEGPGKPTDIGHDTPLIRPDVIDMVTTRLVERLNKLDSVMSRHYLGQEPISMPEFEISDLHDEKSEKTESGDYIYQIATKISTMSAREQMAIARSFTLGNEAWDQLEAVGCKYFSLETTTRLQTLLRGLSMGRILDYRDLAKDLEMTFLQHPIGRELKLRRMLPDSFVDLVVRDKSRIMLELHDALFEDPGLNLYAEMLSLDYSSQQNLSKERDIDLHYAMLDIVTKVLMYWQIKDGSDEIGFNQLIDENQKRQLDVLIGNNVETGLLDYLRNKLEGQLSGNA